MKRSRSPSSPVCITRLQRPPRFTAATTEKPLVCSFENVSFFRPNRIAKPTKTCENTLHHLWKCKTTKNNQTAYPKEKPYEHEHGLQNRNERNVLSYIRAYNFQRNDRWTSKRASKERYLVFILPFPPHVSFFSEHFIWSVHRGQTINALTFVSRLRPFILIPHTSIYVKS